MVAWVLLPVVAITIASGTSPERRAYLLLVCVLALVPLTLGTLVARRVPGHACAAWLAAAGPALLVSAVPEHLSAGVLAGTWMLLYLPLAILLLLVPTGRPASRSWTRVGWALTAVVATFIVLCAAQALLPAASGPIGAAAMLALPLFLAGLLACAAAPVARYRRADEGERLQLRWVFLGGMSLPLTLLLCWASYLVLGTPDLAGIGLIVMYLAIPAGTAVALTRPTIADVDRASVATITAGVLCAAALTALSAICLGVGSALVTWSPPVALAVTAALAAGAALSSRPLYRLFDRLVLPERARSVAALQHLQALVDAGRARPADIETTLRENLRDPGLQVCYARLADGALARLDGTAASEMGLSTPIRLHGEVIGLLSASPGRARRPAAAVAKASAALVDRARLHAELDAARADVVASRERLVRAGFEEQRRLERDLHDGAQQRLVALGMRLRVLQRSDALTPAASDELDAAVAELGTAVAELRSLAHGVRPSALDDGLPAALSELAARVPTGIDLDVRAGEVSDDVAVTTYFLVSEAVTNAIKHARADHVQVVVTSTGDHLRVAVTDDGCGGADARGGLRHMADRVGALGGTLSIVSPPGEGTRIEAVLPCAS